MGTVIRATSVSTSAEVQSSVAHAALAAEQCLAQAAIATDDIGLLINVGVFRDQNMVEPAMSALIQKRIGLGLDYLQHPTPQPLFSFDLMNGAVGMLNAIQVASSYLATGSTRYALLVSSDAHPSGRDVPGFPYARVGSAMLLELAARPGFGRVHAAASSERGHGSSASLRFGEALPEGRERMAVTRDADYEQRLLSFAIQSARACADAEAISLGRTLLVTSQPSPSFGVQLATRLEAAGVASVPDLGGDPHTSALTFAYRGVPAGNYDQLLFVAVGAGLTSACAVYRP